LPPLALLVMGLVESAEAMRKDSFFECCNHETGHDSTERTILVTGPFDTAPDAVIMGSIIPDVSYALDVSSHLVHIVRHEDTDESAPEEDVRHPLRDVCGVMAQHGQVTDIWDPADATEDPADAYTDAIVVPEVPDVSISADMSNRNVVRVFRFRTNGVNRSLEVCHKDYVWMIVVDEKAVVSELHKGTSKTTIKKVYKMEFTVPEFADDSVVDGQSCQSLSTLKGTCTIKWSTFKLRWAYAVEVNSMPVPAYFSNAAQKSSKIPYIPDVLDSRNNLYSSDQIALTNPEYMSVLGMEEPAKGKREFKVNRVFPFMLQDEMRGIEIAHQDKTGWKAPVWHILVDGVEVKTLEHHHSRNPEGVSACIEGSEGKNAFGCDFGVKIKSGGELPAFMKMEWDRTWFRWTYSLVINGVHVPESFFKGDPAHPKEHITLTIPTVPEDAVLAITDATPEIGAEGWQSTGATTWKDINWPTHENSQQMYTKQDMARITGIVSTLADQSMRKLGWKQDLVAAKGVLPAVAVYHFTTHRKFRSIAVLHENYKWEFLVDGISQTELTHDGGILGYLSSKRLSAELNVPMEDGEPLPATVFIEWKPLDLKWQYVLTVKDVLVEPVYAYASRSAGLLEVADRRCGVGMLEVTDRNAQMALEDMGGC